MTSPRKLNKGAIAFIDKLEGFPAPQALEADSLKFENLVVEMMDISISSKVPTSENIATTLNDKSWSMQQVASVWTVSTTNPVGDNWNDLGIELLAGKGTVSRILDKLKADQLNGLPKQPAADLEPGSAKRQRLEVSNSKQGLPTTPSLLEGCDSGSATVDTPTMFCPRKTDRKLVKDKRRDHMMV